MTKIFLTGASGLLGSATLGAIGDTHEVVAPDLDRFDLERPETVASSIEEARPRIVIHLAAETRVDYGEQHVDRAFLINGLGTRLVAAACRRAGARMIYLSTDYVFDCAVRTPYSKHDPAHPLSV